MQLRKKYIIGQMLFLLAVTPAFAADTEPLADLEISMDLIEETVGTEEEAANTIELPERLQNRYQERTQNRYQERVQNRLEEDREDHMAERDDNRENAMSERDDNRENAMSERDDNRNDRMNDLPGMN